MPTIPQVVRISIKNILFPTDFSPASSAALPFALAFARMYDATLLPAHVLPPEPRQPIVTDRVPAQDNRIWLEAQDKLARLTQPGLLGDVHCKTLLDQG